VVRAEKKAMVVSLIRKRRTVQGGNGGASQEKGARRQYQGGKLAGRGKNYVSKSAFFLGERGGEVSRDASYYAWKGELPTDKEGAY